MKNVWGYLGIKKKLKIKPPPANTNLKFEKWLEVRRYIIYRSHRLLVFYLKASFRIHYKQVSLLEINISMVYLQIFSIKSIHEFILKRDWVCFKFETSFFPFIPQMGSRSTYQMNTYFEVIFCIQWFFDLSHHQLAYVLLAWIKSRIDDF